MLVSLNDSGTSVPLLQRNIKGDENFNLQKNYKKKNSMVLPGQVKTKLKTQERNREIAYFYSHRHLMDD